MSFNRRINALSLPQSLRSKNNALNLKCAWDSLRMKYFLSWWEGYLYWQKLSLNQGHITSLKYISNITDFLGFYLKCSSQSHSHTYLFILSLFPSLHFSLYFSHSSLNRGSLAHFHLKHNLISFLFSPLMSDKVRNAFYMSFALNPSTYLSIRILLL